MNAPLEKIDIDNLPLDQLRPLARYLRAEFLREKAGREVLQVALGQKQISNAGLQPEPMESGILPLCKQSYPWKD